MKPGLDPARSASKTNMKAARDATIGIPMGTCFMVRDDCDLKTGQGRASSIHVRERNSFQQSRNVTSQTMYQPKTFY